MGNITMYAGTTGQGIKGQLFKAVQTGDLDELGRLVTDANINTVDILGQTLAHHAAMLEDQRILEFLAQHGADLKRRDMNGRTPAHCAADKNCPQNLQVLARFNADLNQPDTNGMTPTHLAVRNRYPECLEKLAQLGANLKQHDRNGRTPAHLAVISRSLLCLEFLAQNGVKIADSIGTGERQPPETPVLRTVIQQYNESYNNLEHTLNITTEEKDRIFATPHLGQILMALVLQESELSKGLTKLYPDLETRNIAKRQIVELVKDDRIEDVMSYLNLMPYLMEFNLPENAGAQKREELLPSFVIAYKHLFKEAAQQGITPEKALTLKSAASQVLMKRPNMIINAADNVAAFLNLNEVIALNKCCKTQAGEEQTQASTISQGGEANITDQVNASNTPGGQGDPRRADGRQLFHKE